MSEVELDRTTQQHIKKLYTGILNTRNTSELLSQKKDEWKTSDVHCLYVHKSTTYLVLEQAHSYQIDCATW